MEKKLRNFKNRAKYHIVGLILINLFNINSSSAQSDFNIEAYAVFSTFNFTAKNVNPNTTTVANTNYSHTTVSAFSLGYTHSASNGLLLLGSLGVRQAGSSLIYNSINYIWNMHYADIKAGVGYQFDKWRLKPFVSVCPYYGYLLNGTQTFNQESYDLKANKSLKNNDYGLFANVGFKAALSPYISVYTEYNYILGLQNIETGQNQYLYNRGFSVKFGVALTITNSTKPKIDTIHVITDDLAVVPKKTTPPAAGIVKFGDGWGGAKNGVKPTNQTGSTTGTTANGTNSSQSQGNSTSGNQNTSNASQSNGSKGNGNGTSGNQYTGNVSQSNGSQGNGTSGNQYTSNGSQSNGSQGNGTSGNQHTGNGSQSNGSQGNGTSGNQHTGNGSQSNGSQGNGTSGNQNTGNVSQSNGSQGNGTSGNQHTGNGSQSNGSQGNGTSGNQYTGNGSQSNGSQGNGTSGNQHTGNGYQSNGSQGNGTSGNQHTGNVSQSNGSQGNVTSGNSSNTQGNDMSGNQNTGKGAVTTTGSTTGIASNNVNSSQSQGKEMASSANNSHVENNVSSKETTKNNNHKNKEKEITGRSEAKSINSEVVFKVQLTAVKNPLTNSHPLLKNMKGKIEKEKGKDGWIRYYEGSFKNYEEAHAELNKLRSKGLGVGSFVVAFKSGKKITVSEANELVK
jgi:hypothetical protein